MGAAAEGPGPEPRAGAPAPGSGPPGAREGAGQEGTHAPQAGPAGCLRAAGRPTLDRMRVAPSRTWEQRRGRPALHPTLRGLPAATLTL